MKPLNAVSVALLALCGPLAPCLASPQERAPSPLEQALATVDLRLVEADLAFLGDPSLEGRVTPSKGLRVASAFVSRRLARMDWTPAGSREWQAPFPLFALGVDPLLTAARMDTDTASVELLFAGDVFPERLGQLRAWDRKGPLVSVGAGEEADVAAAKLEGCWALVHEGKGSVRGAVLRATAAGAVGVLVTPGPECLWPDYGTRFKAVAETMLRGLVTHRPRRENPEGDPAVVMLTPEAAKRLLTLARVPWPGKEEGALPPAGIELGIEFQDRRTLVDPKTEASNIVAVQPGSDPRLTNEVILVTAHLDHLGELRGDVHPGANDNASGVASLLAVAEALKARGPGRRSVVLLFLVGTEKGSWGAQGWVANPSLPEGMRPVAVVNLDRTGRLENDLLHVTPSPTHRNYNPVAAAVGRAARDEGLMVVPFDHQWTRLDTRIFAEAGLPVVSLSSGLSEDSHLPSDTLDKVSPDSVARLARVTLRLLESLDGDLPSVAHGPSVADGNGPGPPDTEQAFRFGMDLVEAADTGVESFFLDALDRRALIGRALASSQGSSAATSAERAWLSRAPEVERLWHRVLEISGDNGQYSVLRVEQFPSDGEHPARCELVMRLARETDFDYHRLLLERDSARRVRVVDVYAFSLDEWASEWLGRHHRVLTSHPASMTDLENGRAPRCLAPLAGLRVHYDDPELGAAMELLNGLPEDLVGLRDYLRMSMLYTWSSRRAAWAEARGAFEAAFPEAPGAVIWAVCDTHGWDPEPAELSEALDALEALTGDATYPTFLRGLHSMFAEQPALARPHFASAIALDPEFQESWWGMLSALKALKDWPALMTHLETMGTYFESPFTVEELKRDPSLKEFIASEAFERWAQGKEGGD